MRVVGSPDSNGANITCIAIQLTPMISAATSEPALILVQGDIKINDQHTHPCHSNKSVCNPSQVG